MQFQNVTDFKDYFKRSFGVFQDLYPHDIDKQIDLALDDTLRMEFLGIEVYCTSCGCPQQADDILCYECQETLLVPKCDSCKALIPRSLCWNCFKVESGIQS